MTAKQYHNFVENSILSRCREIEATIDEDDLLSRTERADNDPAFAEKLGELKGLYTALDILHFTEEQLKEMAK